MIISRDIFHKEGIRGFYRGLTATLARECPGYGCFFGVYEFSRTLLTKENETKKDIGKSASSMKNIFIFSHFELQVLLKHGFLVVWPVFRFGC